MSAIQSSVGLITGIPIQDTVDQLISLAARPRNTLATRNQGLEAEQAAIDRLSSLVLSTKLSASRLDLRRTFTGRVVSSTNESAVSASIQSGATPATGSYQFTPLRQATAHQLVSGQIDNVGDLGSGTLSFGYGGQVDEAVGLSQLNGGEGFTGGSIRVTDRGGDSATIDLRGAQTVDDVLNAINNTSDIDVTASVVGDRFVLTDNTGESGTLSVREINGGSTAESLGVLSSAAADTITGDDVYGLGADTELADLRDGLGVYFTNTEDNEANASTNEANDIEITLRDGRTTQIDLSGLDTLGEVIDAINENTELAGGLNASYNADLDGLVLTDTTGSTAENFTVTDLNGGSAAVDLGIATDSAGVASSSIDGDRLISGLKDTLVSTLDAGRGIALGEFSVTDRAGTAVTIDLTGTETLGEIVQAINTQAEAGGVLVSADVNEARNGIVLTDTSGGSGSLVVADADANNVATALGIDNDSAVTTVNGGSLSRQVISAATRLEDFNGGRGVSVADIRITDSSGASSTVNLERTDDDAETIGDVIARINAVGADVTASINETGDGILITDNAGGTGTLLVEESGSGVAAADLGLLGESITTNDSDQQTINGSTRYEVDLSDLQDSAEGTSLAALNDGDGVDLGILKITTTAGEDDFFYVDLGAGNRSDAQTVGDVIDRINEAAIAAGASVTASLSDGESGIVLTDAAGGDEQLTVEDLNENTSAAEQLGLTRSAGDDDNEIDGSGLFTFDGDNALETLVERINDLDAGVTASVFNDGDGFRLSLTSDQTGAGNELFADGLGNVGFTETSKAGDAVALFGGLGGIGGFVVTSATNDFSQVIDGVTLTSDQATGEAVTVDVSGNSQTVIDAAQDFVDSYNSLRTTLDSLTDFDADSQTTGILFGRSEVVRVDTELSRLLTDRYIINGDTTSLQEIGIGVDQEGKLSLDSTKLSDALDESPSDVEDLFRDEDRGVVAKLNEVIDRLAGDENSLLSSRSDALAATITDNESRIETLDASLERQRDRLLLEFFQLEETISLLQSNTSFLDSIVPVTFPSS